MGLWGHAELGRESTASREGLSQGCRSGGPDAVFSSATGCAGGPGLAISPAMPQFPSLGTAKLSALLQMYQISKVQILVSPGTAVGDCHRAACKGGKRDKTRQLQMI